MRSRRKPALFTSTSSRPNVSTAVAIEAVGRSQSATSSPLATASPPMARISSTTSPAGPVEPPEPSSSAPRSLTTTLAPWRANSRACARPMPRPAPVTMTTRPSQMPMRGSSHADLTGRQKRPSIRVRPRKATEARARTSGRRHGRRVPGPRAMHLVESAPSIDEPRTSPRRGSRRAPWPGGHVPTCANQHDRDDRYPTLAPNVEGRHPGPARAAATPGRPSPTPRRTRSAGHDARGGIRRPRSGRAAILAGRGHDRQQRRRAHSQPVTHRRRAAYPALARAPPRSSTMPSAAPVHRARIDTRREPPARASERRSWTCDLAVAGHPPRPRPRSPPDAASALAERSEITARRR